MDESKGHSPIPAHAYDEFYFLNAMDGAEEFASSHGQKINKRLEYVLKVAQVLPYQRVLDLGCGRGEIVYHCAHMSSFAHGIDYSTAALSIACLLKNQARELGLHMELEQATSGHLPFTSQSFDTIFMIDIIEHLVPEELLQTLYEVHRLLKSGGQLIIHTMPNDDYYRWGYPIYRIFMSWVGRRLPKDPRSRWYGGDTHINIMSPGKLKKIVLQAGFSPATVWLKPLSGKPITRFVINIPPWRWILVNDIICKAIKP